MRSTSTFLALIVLVLSILVIISYLPRIFLLLPGEPGDGGEASSAAAVQSSASSSAPAATIAPPPPVPPARESSCTDGTDNDGDQLVDCDDPDCVGSAECRCVALSCGGSGPQCSNANGCICDAVDGCVSCRNEGQSCGTDADCCGGIGLSCTGILRADGTRERRCLRSQARVCDITCEGSPGDIQGTWSRTSGCGVDFVPPSAQPCTTLTGACDISPRAERNTVKCWES